MNRAHRGLLIVASAVVWMASAPRSAWGQSAWPGYPSNTAISITSGGFTGIGTANPSQRLEVAGGVQLDDRGDNCCTAVYMIDGAHQTHLYNYSWGGFEIHQYGTNSVNGAVLSILPGGNVGIGTTNPQYLLAVKGVVGAEEFIVTNTGWSDYVFQPGYRLRPLREVSAYIQANHHLPDIPSEAEVREKGVGVGEMQSKLLAKVEELTLHMIQAEERNNRLERQNQDLRGRIARLEKGAAGAPGAGK